MRAAYLTRERHLEVRQASEPGVGPGEVAVAVSACGICGSNLHTWWRPELSLTKAAEPEPGAAGHEVAARVVASGPETMQRSPGDRVVIEPNLTGACGECEPCRRGTYWFCRHRVAIPIWGFADRMVVPDRSLFVIPDALSDATATLVEPLACGVHALRASTTARERGLEGVRVAVLGAGVTGLLALVAAKHLGAGPVAITARHEHQATAAEALGADVVLAEDDPVRALKDHRPDVVVEAVGGSAATFEQAMRAVGPRGEVVVLGLFDEPQPIDARRAVFRELRVFFPVTYAVIDGVHDFDVALAMLGADPDRFDPLITHRFSLDDIDDAFAAAADKRNGSLRVVVEP